MSCSHRASHVLTHSVPTPRPSDLLGFGTGCRLAGLVYLQGRDVKWHRAAQAWVFDRHETIRVEGRELLASAKRARSSQLKPLPQQWLWERLQPRADRKSTRLNSSQ